MKRHAEHAEHQYLDLIREILERGEPRTDRTGTGTRSIFGARMRFDLAEGFPLLTTKRVFWRGVAEELLWFLSGSTDASVLSNKGVRIWDGHGSRAYLDSLGLTDRAEGDLGPIYGYQWRHFGATYVDAWTNYGDAGVDQISTLIRNLKTDPTSRRHILCAWNPPALAAMALPPCHVLCQFYVTNAKKLNCQLYQRSGDVGLGIPFNIASYSLLTMLIAHCCDLTPGEFIHVLGDAHIYANHVTALRAQLTKEPRPFPTLSLPREKKNMFEFTFDDFCLENYDPHPAIPMTMAV